MLSSDDLSCYSSQVMLGVRNPKVHFKFVGGRQNIFLVGKKIPVKIITQFSRDPKKLIAFLR